MSLPKGAAVLAVVLLGAEFPRQECRHPGRGPTRRVSLERVRKAQEEVKAILARSFGPLSRLSPIGSFDSGLPACGFRKTRIHRTANPAALVGKTVAVAPAGRMPRADLRVASSAKRLGELEADALADGPMIERLGVRCAPTLVRMRSETELELVENP